MTSKKDIPPAAPKDDDRRHNHELRERLDELMAMARKLSQQRDNLSQEELQEARERIEWLAGEIWGAAAYGPLEDRD